MTKLLFITGVSLLTCCMVAGQKEAARVRNIHYNRLPKGGHFAAWEQAELFTQELRAAFKSLR